MQRLGTLNFKAQKLSHVMRQSLSCVAWDSDLKNIIWANYIGTKPFQDTIITLRWQPFNFFWNTAPLIPT